MTLQAFNAAGRKVAIDKIDKHAWQAAPVEGPITLRYEVYVWDMSVRAAHLDDTVGFFNGTSVFLAVEGQSAAPCIVDIDAAAGRGGSQLARRDGARRSARDEALRLRRV